MSKVAEEEDVKLEDVLKSIRGVIDDHNQNPFSQESDISDDVDEASENDAVLELTDLAYDDHSSSSSLGEELLSSDTKHKVESQINKFVDDLHKRDYTSQEVSLDSTVNQLMRPLIKDWLNNNLPRIVEKVVAEEIQKMIPKK